MKKVCSLVYKTLLQYFSCLTSPPSAPYEFSIKKMVSRIILSLIDLLSDKTLAPNSVKVRGNEVKLTLARKVEMQKDSPCCKPYTDLSVI